MQNAAVAIFIYSANAFEHESTSAFLRMGTVVVNKIAFLLSSNLCSSGDISIYL